ncbi:adenylate kinase, partial [termite gut metagenome]
LITRLIKRGQDSGRTDDNEETIKKRLSVYHLQTAPLIDWYKKESKYRHIQGNGNMDEITAEIVSNIPMPPKG